MFTDREQPYEEKRLRLFWTHRWVNKTPEEWEEDVLKNDDSTFSNNRHKQYREKMLVVLKDALTRLVLEGRLKREEGINLYHMLTATDKESRDLALIIMAKKKHKIFLKQ